MNWRNLERQIICLLIIIVCYVIPTYFTDNFGIVDGTFRIAPFWGIVIIVGILARWKYIKEIALFIFGLISAGCIMAIFLSDAEYRWAFAILTMLNILIVGLLFRMENKQVNDEI